MFAIWEALASIWKSLRHHGGSRGNEKSVRLGRGLEGGTNWAVVRL